MNNTLDFNRLGKVIRRDGMNYIPNFGWSLVILWAIPLVVWLIDFIIIDQGGEIVGRSYALKFLAMIALIIAPSKLYKDCNDSRKGIQYAMMPASSLEKFLSMFLFCVIVTPIAYMVGAVAVDTILAAIPGKNPYEGFIFKSLFSAREQSRDIMESLGTSSAMYDQAWDNINESFSGFFLYLSKILSTILTASFFMFGNMIFKKRKTSKMIGILILIFTFLMIFFIKWTIKHEDFMIDTTDEELARNFMIHLMKTATYIGWTISIIVSGTMLGLTYYKIKTQKY